MVNRVTIIISVGEELSSPAISLLSRAPRLMNFVPNRLMKPPAKQVDANEIIRWDLLWIALAVQGVKGNPVHFLQIFEMSMYVLVNL